MTEVDCAIALTLVTKMGNAITKLDLDAEETRMIQEICAGLAISMIQSKESIIHIERAGELVTEYIDKIYEVQHKESNSNLEFHRTERQKC